MRLKKDCYRDTTFLRWVQRYPCLFNQTVGEESKPCFLLPRLAWAGPGSCNQAMQVLLSAQSQEGQHQASELGTLFPKDLFCKTTPHHIPAVPYRPSQNSGCAGYSRHSIATTMGGMGSNANSPGAERPATPLPCQQYPLPSLTPFCLWTSKAVLLQVIKGF